MNFEIFDRLVDTYVGQVKQIQSTNTLQMRIKAGVEAVDLERQHRLSRHNSIVYYGLAAVFSCCLLLAIPIGMYLGEKCISSPSNAVQKNLLSSDINIENYFLS